MTLYMIFKYWKTIVAFDALLNPLLLLEINDVHEFITDGVAVNTLQRIDNLS